MRAPSRGPLLRQHSPESPLWFHTFSLAGLVFRPPTGSLIMQRSLSFHKCRSHAAVVLVIAVAFFPHTRSAQAQDQKEALHQRGQQLYSNLCADCHGDRGRGVEDAYRDTLAGDLSIVELAAQISRTMPAGEPEKCTGADAAAVAAFVHDAFYSEDARIRNDPPGLKLTHLTGSQLRQSVADLYGHFVGPTAQETKRGITGTYYNGARVNKSKLKIDRVDAAIDFDWMNDAPGEGIDAKDFAIRWQGGLKIDETGRYEIVIRSTSAFVCALGNSRREFINNRVQSGDKTEFRKSIVLTTGRVYPLQIDLYQRKRKTEQPPVRISLAWIPPDGIEQVIPQRHLVPGFVRPSFSLQTKMPADDRSYGFERGLTIDRQWDTATTSSAIEFAQIATNELWPEYQRRHKNDPNENRAMLRTFLAEVITTAFRGPIDETSKQFYIDEQVDQTEDDAEAIRRSVLVALKSPRFLYPALDTDRSASQRAANRLALTLFDSLPADEWLTRMAAENRLQNANEIRGAAQRMVNDFRTQGKTHEFLYEWLNLSHLGDIVKNADRFPGFKDEIAADQKASLDAFLNEVVWSEASDFRQLFLASWSYTTPRLTEFYGDEWTPAEDTPSDFARTADLPARRVGFLNHPYLMSGLAYQDSTSPIHRGVFLTRSILGRSLRPPKEAFTPLSPTLHPDLTTRQRVELQTSPDGCRACHTKINGLGFTLENFDAVGRFREREGDKPLDTAGHYTTRDGKSVTFRGASELAEFLADSHDVHRAFVKRAFQHFVKQPVAAFGIERLKELTNGFRNDGFNIRNLLVEIAVIAASEPGDRIN